MVDKIATKTTTWRPPAAGTAPISVEPSGGGSTRGRGGGSGDASTPSTETKRAVSRAIQQSPSGTLSFRFTQGDLSASKTASKMFRTVVVDSSTVQGAQLSIPMVFSGSIYAMTMASDKQKQSGTVSFQAFIEGRGGARLDWGRGTAETKEFPANKHTFRAGDLLDVRVSTRGLSPAGTINVEVIVYLVQTK